MAYLIAKRIYQGELIPLLTKRMTRSDAEHKLGEIRAFPGVVTEHVDDDPELWFEVEEEWGDLAGFDPVCFPGYLAYETLVRTGVKPSEASRLLSDEYAAQWLAAYRAGVDVI